MSTESDWKPGYNTIKTRYPYDAVESRLTLPVQARALFQMDPETRKVGVHVDATVFPKQAAQITSETSKEEHLQYLVDFLMDRSFENQQALKVAEDQVMELLHEDPFDPEQFGFALIHEPETIHDSPIRLYQSTFDDEYSLHRPIKDTTSHDWNPAIWTLQCRDEDGTFTHEDVELPCHRIAFAYFYAKRIKVMESKPKDFIEDAVIEEEVTPQGPGSESPVIEESPVGTITPPKGFNNYTVVYTQKEFSMPDRKLLSLHLDNIMAQDEKDAQTQAKFLIETGDYGIELVEFEELTPVLKFSN